VRIAVMTFGVSNALAADLPLPSWYWGELSGMHCLDTAVAQLVARGCSHHIQRLMALSNIATLLGVDPQALYRWFWEMYVDAYEWVVAPNVAGMATWADGGIVGSKPHVSSGKYIQRLGPSLCAGCQFDPATTSGAAACPLNHLYWNFLERHRARFAANVRMAVPLAAPKKLPQAVMADHREHAAAWQARAAGVIHGPCTG
jgi:deoxyribodipyrimidine photolyase-related protein